MQTTLPLRQIAEDVFVAPQLDAAAMGELARLGFRSVVNNRPDFEHGPDFGVFSAGSGFGVPLRDGKRLAPGLGGRAGRIGL